MAKEIKNNDKHKPKVNTVEMTCIHCGGTTKEPMDLGDNLLWIHNAKSISQPCTVCKGKGKVKVNKGFL